MKLDRAGRGRKQRVIVADPDTAEPVPCDGATMGEIMLRGNTVMKGYLNNPSATERTLKDNRDKLEEADASTIEGRIMELRGVLESSDVNEIRQKTQALQEASHKLAEAVYAQAAAQAQASAGGNGSTDSGDEVVEEGEYEVVDEEAKTS